MSVFCLIPYTIAWFLYGVTFEKNQDNLNSVIVMDTKTRTTIHYYSGLVMIMFMIIIVFLTCCGLLYKTNKLNLMLTIFAIVVKVAMVAMIVLWVETEQENPDLDGLLDYKKKESVHLFTLWLFEVLTLSIFFIMISFSAFVILQLLFKKTKTTSPDAKLKPENKTAYGALKV